MTVLEMLGRRLAGPPPALPRLLDGLADDWWRLPARARLALVVVAVTAVVGCTEARVQRARSQWGGPPRRALVAVDDATVGDRPALRTVELPPAMVPDDAPQAMPDDATLALALPRGAVLTRAHLSPGGPAVGLDPDLRVVPVPVHESWDVRPGVRVDVWVLGSGPDGSQRIAAGRPVVAVTSKDDRDHAALVGLATEEVADVVEGLAQDRVLLTQAPP